MMLHHMARIAAATSHVPTRKDMRADRARAALMHHTPAALGAIMEACPTRRYTLAASAISYELLQCRHRA